MIRRLVDSPRPGWPFLACLLVIACGGGDSSPEPGDTTPPTVQATPPGGSFAAGPSVALLCNDGGGSGCAVVRYTTDGSTPTASSAAYAAPIAISTSTTLRFFGMDNAGNASDVRTEQYLIDPDPPSVSASPAGGTYVGAQSVTLSCDDGAGSGCAAIHYTTDGSAPTTGSPAYTAPIDVSVSVTLRFLGVDAVGNESGVSTETYVIETVSTQIAAIRAAADGSVSLPVTGALVTYARPLIGADAAGFFLQDAPAGPAVFVSVDPATLSPAPAAGDRVSLTATAKTTVSGRAEVTALTGFAVLSTGESVEPLRADVSAVADLPSLVGEYESELVAIDGTVSGAFGSAGTGFVSAPLSTVGTPASSFLVVRVPTAIQTAADLAAGCSVTVRAPLWRFNQLAQATAWAEADLVLHACPAPRVISAVASSATEVTVRFDRQIEPASVAGDGSQFTLSGGLVAASATVSGHDVQVGTSTQAYGQAYTVTVAATVTDTLGTGVDTAANSADFTGYRAPALLRLTEVAPNIPSSRDLVELVVLQGGSTLGMTLVQDTTTVLATFPDAEVATGDVIVVHLNAIDVADAPASETTAKDEYPAATYASNHDTAWDFHGGSSGIIFSNRVLRVNDPVGTTQDGAAFVRPTMSTPPSGFPASLQALQADGHWLPSDCGGVLCTYVSTPTAVAISASWEGVSTDPSITIRRVDPTDTDTASDWAVGASSLGAP